LSERHFGGWQRSTLHVLM